MYLNIYFKITGKKDNKNKKFYERICGESDFGFPQETRTYFEQKIRKEYEDLGYKISNIAPCSESEAATGIEDYSAPLGYIEMYFEITVDDNGNKTTSYMKCENDFNRYFGAEFADEIAAKVQELFQEQCKDGKIVSVKECTREDYHKNTDEYETVTFTY